MVTQLLGLFLYLSTGGAGSWRLPARAIITIEPAHLLPGYPENDTPCSTRRITVRQLRRKFATYHELKEMELHDGYADMGCAIEGDIVVDGKKFRYIEQPINLLQTNWPDGKMHQLGGKHSDDSSIQ